MQWTDAAADWEEAAADPPRVERESMEMRWVEDGFVLAPEDGDEAAALFSTVACKVGNEPANREFGPQPDTRGSTEAEN